MKYAMLVLALVASVVNAADIGRIKNEAGGEIVLTAEKCADGSHVAYGYGSKSNSTIWGCHFPMDGAIWIKWKHQDTPNRYSFENIQWSKEFLETVKKNNQTY